MNRAGFAAARMFGSEHNDAIEDNTGKTRTNHAGGIVGGITNGNELVFRIAIKPTSSTPKLQQTLNWETNQVEDFSVKGRHDLCIALRVPVVLEAVTALVLGARAVFVGRPFMYAAAVGGQAGVRHAIDLLASEVDRDMAMLGTRSIDEVDASLLLPRAVHGHRATEQAHG